MKEKNRELCFSLGFVRMKDQRDSCEREREREKREKP